MRLAHISDLHFGSVSLNPLQFFSKRWVGSLNFLFNRKKTFKYNRLIELIDLLKNQKVTHVVITGDFTVTARSVEYQMGQRFIKLLQNEGLKVFSVPGNHDHYTMSSFLKKRFYRFFPPSFDSHCPLNLRDHCVTFSKIGDGLWLLGLDTAIASPLFSAEGLFGPVVEKNLNKALNFIPKDEKIILFNHYPFFINDKKRRGLKGAENLKKLLQKAPNIDLYLHGHTHRQIIADLRESKLPIISDTGSTSQINDGACHLFEINNHTIELVAYKYENGWQEQNTHQFKL